MATTQSHGVSTAVAVFLTLKPSQDGVMMVFCVCFLLCCEFSPSVKHRNGCVDHRMSPWTQEVCGVSMEQHLLSLRHISSDSLLVLVNVLILNILIWGQTVPLNPTLVFAELQPVFYRLIVVVKRIEEAQSEFTSRA